MFSFSLKLSRCFACYIHVIHSILPCYLKSSFIWEKIVQYSLHISGWILHSSLAWLILLSNKWCFYKNLNLLSNLYGYIQEHTCPPFYISWHVVKSTNLTFILMFCICFRSVEMFWSDKASFAGSILHQIIWALLLRSFVLLIGCHV